MKFRTIGLLTILLMALPLGASAAPRDDALAALAKCATVADNTERLACYDQLAPKVKEAMGTPPATLDRPPTKEEQESWFGFNLGGLFGSEKPTKPEDFGKERTPEAQAQVAQAEAEVESIGSKVTEYAYTPFGKFIVFLDNGQVWRQIKGDAEQAHFKKNPGDNTVEISRGTIASYNMTINGGNKVYKVTRVK